MIDAESGAPLLTDFGIAKATLAGAQLTTAGQLIGTPHYMSPEQASGRSDVGPQSDLYSLGVVAYEMVSGRRPFDAETSIDALTQRLTRDPKPLGSTRAGIPPELALAVDRCLQRDAAKRWPDAKSLRDTLLPSEEESEETLPGRAVRFSAAIGSITVLVFAYLSVYLALNVDVHLPARGVAVLVAGFLPMVVLGTFGARRLRSEGLNSRSILVKALQQPRWWRSWYPRPLRRRGDLWNRLPAELRRFRLFRGLLQIFAVGIFLPFHFMTLAGRHVPAVQWVGGPVLLLGIAGLYVLRRRTEKFVRAKVGATAAEASAILTTPTWRLTAWRRAPIGSLLLGQKAKASPAVVDLSEAVTRLSDSADSEQATQA